MVKEKKGKKEKEKGTSLVAQWLRPPPASAGNAGLKPPQ